MSYFARVSGPSYGQDHDQASLPPSSTLRQDHPSADELPASSHAPSQEVTELARHLSTQSTVTGQGDIFKYETGSKLDPFGDTFDPRLWVSKFASLEDWGQGRMSGISFKDMTVFGHGTDAGKSPSRSSCGVLSVETDG
jgi:hypothetical protein